MGNSVHSMTGFARGQCQQGWGSAVFEIRSINHRYLEMSVHLPETLRALESAIRDQIRHYIKRGKVECYLRYHPSDKSSAEMNINMHLAAQICKANDKIAKLLKTSSTINVMDILNWPGVMEMGEIELEMLEDDMIQLLEKTLKDLVDVRTREGNELRELFFQRLDAMQAELVKVKQFIPDVMNAQREKLMARFSDAKLELDPNRLEQEMVMFTQRTDVVEEMERLLTHISETRRTLKQGGLVGRRLDFLMQELHREANTLGSKSVDVNLTRASVELKVLIEQMREQVQNIE